MKGVILAGGLGKQLWPLTKITNKHLLPVFDKPMIYYPIECLVNAGIRDVLLVTGGNDAGDFPASAGQRQGIRTERAALHISGGRGRHRRRPALAEDFADGDKIVVVLGDNIIERDIRRGVSFYSQPRRGCIFLKSARSRTFRRWPCWRWPRHASSRSRSARKRYAVVGIYMYDEQVFDFISSLKPSARGELEITDVNNFYLEQGTLEYEILEGWWTDAGTFESLLKAANLTAGGGANHTRPMAAAVPAAV